MSRPCFVGWYLKYTGGGGSVAFIPGMHVDTRGERRAFIQVITSHSSWVIDYPGDAFQANSRDFQVKVGESIFSRGGIAVNIQRPHFVCQGQVHHGAFTPPRRDVMGPFCYVPGLACRHGVLSLRHRVSGILNIQGQDMAFKPGIGYIETDRGHSFPKRYSWFAASDLGADGAVVAALADVPVLGGSFPGFFAVLRANGVEFPFATYNGARVLNQSTANLTLGRGKYRLVIDIDPGEGLPLNAPELGEMRRVIHERVACEAKVQLLAGAQVIYESHSRHAGHEHVE